MMSQSEKLNELSHDTLILDKYLERLQHFAEVQNQLGENEKGILINKAKQIIALMANHCTSYSIGLPIAKINYILMS